MPVGTLGGALPAPARARARAFCLRGVGESMPTVGCPIAVGFAAPGKLLEDVSFINASFLVRRGAIRLAGTSPLAFFERPEWLREGFGEAAGPLIQRCLRLTPLPEPARRPPPPGPAMRPGLP